MGKEPAIDAELIEARRERLMKRLLAEFYAARSEQGLSLGDVSRRCGMSVPELSRFENGPGRNPTLKLLLKVAAALGKELRITLD